MECSPTRVLYSSSYRTTVAVPVNYGMLSYKWYAYKAKTSYVAVPVNYGMLSYPHGNQKDVDLYRRSPRQLWNALLHVAKDWRLC